MFERLSTYRARLAIGGVALAAIVGLGLVPLVSAASPQSSAPSAPSADPSPLASPGASGAAKARGVAGIRAAILAGTVRAEFTIVKRDGRTVLIHYERGQVTAVTPTSITITGRDSKGATFVVTDKTRVRAKGQPIAYSDLKVGDRAMVFGTDSGGTYTAVLIRCVRPAPAS
ncbi:MAG TPA: DUF5666 domain-containing protein [Candidatus Dormibacteraeota bacterium]|nr:DUF5666 domain-containing protein [Candidatus Dormibacteraeota bacterium]